MSNKLFLLDGIGATVSALFLGVVLMQFQMYFGMPSNPLYILTVIAILMALHSFGSYFWAQRRRKSALTTIAIGNLIYCLITLVFLAIHYKTIELLGWVYFIVEFIILILISYAELNCAKKISTT